MKNFVYSKKQKISNNIFWLKDDLIEQLERSFQDIREGKIKKWEY